MVAGKVKASNAPPKIPQPPSHFFPSYLLLQEACNDLHHLLLHLGTLPLLPPRGLCLPGPAQAQDIFEVLCLVDHLRDRESQLLTQLLQLKLIHDSSSVEVASKNAHISVLSAKLQDLERDNEWLRKEVDEVRLGATVMREENERRIGELRAEIEEMRKSASSSSDSEGSGTSGSGGGHCDTAVSSSQRFWLRQNADMPSLVAEKRTSGSTVEE